MTALEPVNTILRTTRPVTLVGGGPVLAEDLAWSISRAPCIAAADGGAETLVAAGYVPEAVIGDLDSLSDAALAKLPKEIVHYVDDQDSTDFEKCLSRITAPFIIGLGFLGGRLDHTMAALSTLARDRVRCILLGSSDVVFAAPALLRLNLSPGTRVSLFPMGPVGGRSQGLRWPIDGMRFDPGGRIGTSNEATGPVHLEAEGVIVLLPQSERDVALGAFTTR